MAEEKVVNLKINSNVVETTEDVKKLNSALDNTAKEVDNVNEAGQGTSKLSAGFGKAGDAVEALQPGLKGAVSGMKAMLVQMWAIVANPIGLVVAAIVAGLTLLYKAFENSFAGGEKLEQIMAGISATGQSLLDNLDRIGKAIIKVFTLDFSGAKKEIQGVATAAKKAFDDMSRLTKQAQQLSRDQADNDLDAIKRQAKLADLKDKLLDDNVSYKEKKKIQADLLKLSEENAKADLKLAKDIADNKIAQLSLEKDGAKKNYEEIRKIQAEQLQGEIDNSRELKQIRKAGATLDREELARIKQINDERKQAAKQLADEKKRIDDELTKSIQDNAKRLKEIDDQALYENKNATDQLTAIADANKAKQDAEMKAKGDYAAWKLSLDKFNYDESKKISDKQISDAQAEADAKIAIQTQFGDAIAGSLGAISQLFEQGTAASKIAALAEIAIGTGTGFINALDIAQKSAKATGPAAVFAFPIFYATQLAAVLGAASKAKNVLNTVKGGGGGGSVPSAPSNIARPTFEPSAPQFNVVGTSGVNQIGQALNKEQPIVKAYVVASDVSTAQALDRNIIKSSSLG